MPHPAATLIRSRGKFTWRGIPTLIYKPSGTGFKKIIRRVTLGEREPDLPFQIRYFEMRREGYSSLECHDHRHAVVVIRGRGRIFLRNKLYALKPFDSIYIGKNVVHQFYQTGREPFGFLCVVAARRDRPRLVSESEARRLRKRYAIGTAFLKT